jgi:hypothetical protein
VSFADEIDDVEEDVILSNAVEKKEDTPKQTTTIKAGSGRFKAFKTSLRAKVGMLGVY